LPEIVKWVSVDDRAEPLDWPDFTADASWKRPFYNKEFNLFQER